MKRGFDILLALVLILPSIFLCITVATVVLVFERASPAFVQTRVGRHEHPFRILKLRTMRKGTVSVGTHEVPASAVTPIGRIARRLKVDELPQIWNVLVGEMSFVGPRPCLPMQHEVVEARRDLGVYSLRPGITGRSQVRGIDMSTPAELARSDAEYLQEGSLLVDMRILVHTLTGGGFGDLVVPVVVEPTARGSAERRVSDEKKDV